jgi:outer membrane immunogenic protein
MKSILLASTVLFAASSAYAADAVVYNEPAPVVADTFSWTGGYIGVNAGYAGGKFKHPFSVSQFEDEEFDQTLNGSLNITSSGFVGGVQAGYNWQFDRTVFGVETDIQGSGLKGEVSGNLNLDNVIGASARAGTKVSWFGTTRARLGYTATERFLVYATGGVAYGKVKSYADFNLNDQLVGGISKSKTKVGFTVGAGAEYAITDHVTLKSEYLYTDLGKLKLFDLNDEFSSASAEAKVKFHTVRVGLNYKF